MKNKFKGIFPAIASPCDEAGLALDTDKYSSLVTKLYQQGIDGLYICGSTGDCRNLTFEDRKTVARIGVEIGKDFNGKAIFHIGGCASTDSFRLAEYAAEIGADAVASFPSALCAYKDMAGYYKELVKVSQLPVLFYHFPAVTYFDLTLDQIIALLDIDGVVGMKFTSTDLMLENQILLARPDIVLFHGFEENVCTALANGVTGAVGALGNLFPQIFTKMLSAVENGNINEAMSLQNKLMPLLDVMKRYNILDVVEYLMRKRGLADRCYRKPHKPIDETTGRKLEAEIKDHLTVVEKLCE